MIALNFIWNSNEILATIDLPFVHAFSLRYYSLMFIVAFSLGWYLTKKIYLNEGKTVQQLDTLFVYTAVATLVGARLGDCFFYNWDYFKDHLLEIFLPIKEKPGGGWELTGFSGLASHGAAVGIIIVQGGAISPRQAMEITQQSDPQSAYQLIVHDPRFSEILASIPYQHPAQLYEAFGYFCLFWVLWYVYWKTDKKNKPYFIFGLFLIALWSIRFAVEFVKESQGGFESSLGLLSTGQWLSIPFIIVGFYLLFRKTQKV